MSEGKRPGGLTALAVLNFIWGGLSALMVLGMFAILALLGKAERGGDEGARKAAEAWEKIGTGMFYGVLALMAVTAALLIASGIGYLKQKRFLGRTLGNAYAIVSIGSSLVFAALVPTEANGGFNMGTIVGFVYPGLTLFLLNRTFKEDFVNP
jgi:hypothetical protein